MTISNRAAKDWVVLLGLALCMGLNGAYAIPSEPVLPKQQELIEQWGIEALKVTLSANGYMVDFRYRVIDPKKAAKAVNRRDQPYLRNLKTGRNSLVPSPANIGALRHTGGNLQKGKHYFVLFANPGKAIKRGDKVNLVMGGYALENVTVQ